MAKSKLDIIKDNIPLIIGWKRDGFTDQQVAKKLNIAYSTLTKYKASDSEVSEALRAGKEFADYEVENALFKKAKGYDVITQKAIKCKEIYYDDKNRRCERETVKVVDVCVHVPPDTMAATIYLNNRLPDKYRRNANKEKLDEKKFKHEKKQDEKEDW